MDSQIKKIHQQLVSKQITCKALVQEKLDQLKQNTYNSVNSILDTLALDLASKVDTKIENCEKIGLLEGIMNSNFMRVRLAHAWKNNKGRLDTSTRNILEKKFGFSNKVK